MLVGVGETLLVWGPVFRDGGLARSLGDLLARFGNWPSGVDGELAVILRGGDINEGGLFSGEDEPGVLCGDGERADLVLLAVLPPLR